MLGSVGNTHIAGPTTEGMYVMRKLIATIAAATMVMAACGGDGGGGNGGGSPKETLSSAVENLGSGGHTVTVSVDSDTASLSALSEGSLTEENAQKILDSSLSISSNGADDPADAEFSMVANVAGNEDVEIRFVDGTLYLRVDVDSLLDLAGPENKAAAQAQLNAFVQQAKASGLDFLEPAVQGEWIAFTGINALLEQMGAASPSAEEQAVINQFTEAVTKDATVTSEGDEDAGEHLVATANLRDLYDNIVSLAKELGQGATDLPADNSQVPDQDVSVDFWVADGNLTQVEFDFAQLKDIKDAEIPEGVDKFGILLQIEDFDGGVEVPSGATEVDLAQLIQMFTGGLGGSDSTSTGGSTGDATDAFCAQLKDQPESVQKQFADQCPDL